MRLPITHVDVSRLRSVNCILCHLPKKGRKGIKEQVEKEKKISRQKKENAKHGAETYEIVVCTFLHLLQVLQIQHDLTTDMPDQSP